MSHIDVLAAVEQLEELIERVAQGEIIVITKANHPVARLSPAMERGVRQFGSLKGMISMSDDFDAPVEDLSEYQ